MKKRMETKLYPANPRLDKCKCNHFRQDHWAGKGKCLGYHYGIGFYGSTLSSRCECKKFALIEKARKIKVIINE